jgi:hypothetical protein
MGATWRWLLLQHYRGAAIVTGTRRFCRPEMGCQSLALATGPTAATAAAALLGAYTVVSASSRGAAAAAGVVVSSRFCVQHPCRQPHSRRVDRLFLATRVEAYANGCCIMLLMMMMGTTASCKHGTVCWL